MPQFESVNTTTPQQVIALVAQELRLRPEAIELASDFVEDLGTDSLDKLELLVQLERAFRLRIPHDTDKFETVQDLIDIVLQAPKDMRPSALRRELKDKNQPPGR